jgi:gliding motility-associated-like protein
LSIPSAPTEVKINSLPVVNAGTNVTIPYGTNTTIDATVSGMGPFTYNWSPSSKLINPLIEDPATVNLTATTIFTLMATSSTTSCQNANEVTITISGGALSSAAYATPGTICAGADVHLHALAGGGSGSYTYTWTSTPVGFTSSLANPIVNPLVNTTYNLAVSDGFTTVNKQVAVTVNTLPPTPTIMTDGPTSFCAGSNVNLTSSAGTSYLWSNAATTQSINVSATGSYSVQITNAAGCHSAKSAATIVTVNSLPVTPTISADGPTTFCSGGSVNLSSSAETSYLWSNGATTPSINISTAGNYTVQVTNANGCQSAKSVATIITVNALPPAPAISSDGPTTFCVGGSVTLTSSEGTGYLWSNAVTTQSTNIITAGNYTVRITDADGCQSPASPLTSVTVNVLPVVNITSSNSSMCMNDLKTLTGTPAGGIFDLIYGPGTITGNTLSPTGSGNIIIEYIYSDICVNTASQSIDVNENPVANAGPDQELKFSFETQMNAELASSETGEWSLISGSGHISDIHSPTTSVNELSIGENKFLWKVLNTNCEDTAEVKITVYDMFVPSVITPNGDGKNDNFKISDFSGKVELIIFNRWGNEEYRSGNYLNDWNGRNNKGVELPNDTYFYVLKFENGRVLKGSVFIKR